MSKHLLSVVSFVLVAVACSTSPAGPGVTSTTSSIATTSTQVTASSAVATTTTSPGSTDQRQEVLPTSLSAQIDAVFSHDEAAFTQGLALRDGLLYESTGMRGDSSVRIVDLASGELLASVELADEYFGEGLEVVGNRIVQLTLTAGIAFIWDIETLAPIGTYSYDGEGWGLCARQEQFYMSDGSSQLTIRDIETFEPIGTIDVTFDGEPVENLNELECTSDGIFANVWQSDEIVVINPESGFVISRVVTDSLRAEIDGTAGEVLNGIAYDQETGAYYVTGKYWPSMFRVHLEELAP